MNKIAPIINFCVVFGIFGSTAIWMIVDWQQTYGNYDGMPWHLVIISCILGIAFGYFTAVMVKRDMEKG